MAKVTDVPPLPPAEAAMHFARKLANETDPWDLAADLAARAQDIVVVDVRDEQGFVEAHIPGAVHLPYAAIDEATCAHFLPAGRLPVVYGWDESCNAPDKAAVRLAGLGRPVKVLLGGLAAWRRGGHPVEGTKP